MDEADRGRWRRRAVSISLVFVLTAVALTLGPLLLPFALFRDLIARSRLAWTRCLLLIAWVVICECWGLLVMFAMWLLSLVLGRAWLSASTMASPHASSWRGSAAKTDWRQPSGTAPNRRSTCFSDSAALPFASPLASPWAKTPRRPPAGSRHRQVG
ncbi:MAG: hypothetical protein HC901_04680 [Bdellovibrionaceae bacterium]|nr:hypothetical protein [Pseudobdellovibrionaceae bacterium]